MNKKKVLLIEDDDDMLDGIAEKLGFTGFEVLTSKKVNDASFKLNNQKFDCIVSDIQLENGSAQNIIAALRDPLTKNPNHMTPIIIISGTLDEDVILGIAKLVQKIFTKPFGINDLVAAVQSTCK